MSKLRKIYKGEENWDSLYDENGVNTNSTKNYQDKANKQYQEDQERALKSNFEASSVSQSVMNNPLNNFSNKFSKVSTEKNKDMIHVDNDLNDETDLQELVFDNIEIPRQQKMNVDQFEVNEKDYENFEQFYDNSNFDHSDKHSDRSLPRKRNYKEKQDIKELEDEKSSAEVAGRQKKEPKLV